LSKVNAIRKKALDCVRKQDWLSAIKEYKRLADIDQSNPNVFNELGDIYLKTGNKNDAYDAFVRAIDSYTRVSLHNNAVAVCKKVRRLIPARYEVLTKLGLIRKKQGLGKEAESYYNTFLDQLLDDQQVGPGEVTNFSAEIVDEMGNSSSVLAKLHECMIKFNLKEETADVLQKLYEAYTADGNETGRTETHQKITELGMNVEAPPVVAAPQESKDGAIITEENIWNEAHTEGERMNPNESESEPQSAVPPVAMGARSDSVCEFGEVKMDDTGTASTSTQTMPEPREAVPETGAPDVAAGEYVVDVGESEEEAEETEYDITPEADAAVAPDADAAVAPEADAAITPEADAAITPEADATVAAPAFDNPVAPEPPVRQDQVVEGPTSSGIASSPDQIHVSAIIGDVDSQDGEMTDEDYRSHYDLGMAYLEMDLLAEAIREYQLSSKSEAYQTRALEMIGICFLRQNRPNLAIKQHTKGLQAINPGDTEALGIKYNLGLAYEMVGDVEQALGAFEDVYVEDVTFREVAKKIEKYS
jgi:tetratricopeptide (TPR) repeat protein